MKREREHVGSIGGIILNPSLANCAFWIELIRNPKHLSDPLQLEEIILLLVLVLLPWLRWLVLLWCVLLYKACFGDFGGGERPASCKEVCVIQTLPTAALASGFPCASEQVCHFRGLVSVFSINEVCSSSSTGHTPVPVMQLMLLSGRGRRKGCGERALRCKACRTSSDCGSVEMARWSCYTVPWGCLWPGDETFSHSFCCLSQVLLNLLACAPRVVVFEPPFVLGEINGLKGVSTVPQMAKLVQEFKDIRLFGYHSRKFLLNIWIVFVEMHQTRSL